MKMAFWVLSLALIVGGCQSGWDPKDAAEEAEKEAAFHKDVQATISAFKAKDATMDRFFKKSHGYVVFPTVGKGAWVIGGAWGKGAAFENNVITGYASITQISIGLSAGGQAFSEIIFFENETSYSRFESGQIELAAQLSAIAATAGASTDADYTKGVAVFTIPRGGLMVDASVGGQKIKYIAMTKKD